MHISSLPLDRYRLAVFDLDGTIVDSEALHVRSYELILSALTGKDRKVTEKEIVGRAGVEIWATLLNKAGIDGSPRRLNQLRKLVVEGLLSSGEVELQADAGVRRLVQDFSGPRIVVTTQDCDSAKRILQSTGLLAEFQDVVTAGSVHPKSKIDVIRELAAAYRIALSEILWIEDASPELLEGKKLGIGIVVVERSYNADKVRLADWCIS